MIWVDDLIGYRIGRHIWGAVVAELVAYWWGGEDWEVQCGAI